jgi:hypothetical protein
VKLNRPAFAIALLCALSISPRRAGAGEAGPVPAMPEPAVAARAVRVSIVPRVVNPVMLKQLQLFDPGADRLRFRTDDGEEREGPEGPPPNESPEYAARGLGTLGPQATAPPTDGPLAPFAAQSFAYVPRLATSFAVRDTGGWYPADCTIAAGPNHLVVAFNSYVAFYDKSGTRQFVSSLDGLFGSQAGWKGHFDPKVVYDEGSGRFLMSVLDLNSTARESEWTIAVSITSDPNQGWYVYGPLRNEWNGEGIDYEDLGYSPRAFYMCGNYISFDDWKAIPLPPDAVDHNNSVWIFDKAAMLAGSGVTWFRFDDLTAVSGEAVWMPRVAQVGTPPTGGVDGFVTAWQGMSIPANTTRISVWGATLPANFPAGSPTLTRTSVDIPTTNTPPNAPQFGGPALLKADNLRSNQLSLIYRPGVLLMPVPVANGALSGAMVLQLGVSWPTVSVTSSTLYNDATNFHLWPNVAMNARGQTMLSYYRSGPLEYANSRWTARFPDETDFLPSALLHSGDGYVGAMLSDTVGTVYRWGDYSGVAVDPVSQGFWLFGMYGSDRGNNNTDWRTWCGFVPRAVFVDPAWAGVQAGTRTRPFTTFGAGLNDTYPGNDLVLKAGTYSVGTGVFSRPALILPDGGTVTLGP